MQGFYNYSACMDADLKTLETKVAHLITLCQTLRSENSVLRQDLAQAQNDTQQLRENIAIVSSRLEAVIERLPEEPV
ncbi:hypothetical protein MTYP_02070 [Methylophilaceae bacterium]|nr:hypothetical protein MTYP_02070 [Methylophilaceae bacterium]